MATSARNQRTPDGIPPRFPLESRSESLRGGVCLAASVASCPPPHADEPRPAPHAVRRRLDDDGDAAPALIVREAVTHDEASTGDRRGFCVSRQEAGAVRGQGCIASSWRATERSSASPPGAATSCTPSGSPSLCRPAGTVSAGNPA